MVQHWQLSHWLLATVNTNAGEKQRTCVRLTWYTRTQTLLPLPAPMIAQTQLSVQIHVYMNTYKYVHAHLHEHRGRQQPRLPHASPLSLSPTARRTNRRGTWNHQPNEQKSPAAPRRTPSARSLLRREKGPERPGSAAPRGGNPSARSSAGWGLAHPSWHCVDAAHRSPAAPPSPLRGTPHAGNSEPPPAIGVQTLALKETPLAPRGAAAAASPIPRRSPAPLLRPTRSLRSPRWAEGGGRKGAARPLPLSRRPPEAMRRTPRRRAAPLLTSPRLGEPPAGGRRRSPAAQRAETAGTLSLAAAAPELRSRSASQPPAAAAAAAAAATRRSSSRR